MSKTMCRRARDEVVQVRQGGGIRSEVDEGKEVTCVLCFFLESLERTLSTLGHMTAMIKASKLSTKHARSRMPENQSRTVLDLQLGCNLG